MMPTKPAVGLSLYLLALLEHVPDMSAFHDDLVEELTQAFLDAYSGANPDVEITSDMRDRAAEFALNRAGELITDISDTTRDAVAEMVSSAVGDGLSIGQLTAALRGAAAFGRDRAEMIARTETAIALGQGQRAAAVDQGQDEKSWVAGNCDICLDNQSDGWIGIDETFSTGDDTIPAHPRCVCSVIYRTRRVHEEAA